MISFVMNVHKQTELQKTQISHEKWARFWENQGFSIILSTSRDKYLAKIYGQFVLALKYNEAE